jgi:putative flippase GtrA
MRVTRYTLGSVVALLTSVVVFALLYGLGVGTTPASVAAFVAGAVPNWVLNRRWAWNVRGRVHIGREVIGYTVISLLALLASSAGTAWTHAAVRGVGSHGLRVALVTLAYVAVQVILFGVKFLAYDLWVFSGRSRVRAAFRSRHQVWVAARANRMP